MGNGRRLSVRSWLSLGAVGSAVFTMAACGTAPEAPTPKAPEATAPAAPAAPKAPADPVPSLVVVQAQFGKVDGRPAPMPARLALLRLHEGEFFEESFEDQDANVFHKAIPWAGGILTIGAERAPKPGHVKHWTRGDDGSWTDTVVWERAWDGSKFNRMRDIEVGDVNGDGKDELVVATHDRGVVAVGTGEGTSFEFVELHEKGDTFVHEIEIGDLNGDGTKEFYSTPSDRNRSSGVSQPGAVYQYTWDGSAYTHRPVVEFEDSHAKEILVTDVNGDGKDELYVVIEAHTVKGEDGKKQRVDPVRIVRYDEDGEGFKATTVSEIDDDQLRFLLAGDVDADGQAELIAASWKAGLFRLELQEDGTFKNMLIDEESSGFEHATHVADLDGDGKLEIYVAADDQKAFRQYIWNGTSFDRKTIADIGPSGRSFITWNIQDGSF